MPATKTKDTTPKPASEEKIRQLEQFPVEVLQTVLLLLQSQEADLENGT